jgi:UDP-N-acetylglucosamine 1-carboxyvinyltransferase
VVPDRIEAGTLMVAGAITGGDVTVENVIPGHMRSLIDKLEECGVTCEPDPVKQKIRVIGDKPRKSVDIVTLPHPGFPTDLQAQMCALMTVTPGLSIVTERIYPNRFMHVPELQRMGADIAIEGPSAIIHGVESLSGAPVMASDLRASAALVLAGLAASGETWVQRIYHLDRGYDRLDFKLRSLGATIDRMPVESMPVSYIED